MRGGAYTPGAPFASTPTRPAKINRLLRKFSEKFPRPLRSIRARFHFGFLGGHRLTSKGKARGDGGPPRVFWNNDGGGFGFPPSFLRIYHQKIRNYCQIRRRALKVLQNS
jgi:hypothetical protein